MATTDTVLVFGASVAAMIGIALGRQVPASRIARQAVGYGALSLVLGLGAVATNHANVAYRHSRSNWTGIDQGDSRLSISIPGAQVEFIGVSVNWHSTMSPAWWSANGSRLRLRSWSLDPGYAPRLVSGERQRRFVVHAHGDVERPKVMAMTVQDALKPTREFVIHSSQGSTDDWKGCTATVGDKQPSANVRVLVASGAFEDRDRHVDDIQARMSKGTDDATVIVTLKPTSPYARREYRLHLLTRDGESHDYSIRFPSRYPDNGKSIRETCPFPDVRAGDVASVVLQSRPCYWVEFQDVALSPGESQTPRAILLEVASDP